MQKVKLVKFAVNLDSFDLLRKIGGPLARQLDELLANLEFDTSEFLPTAGERLQVVTGVAMKVVVELLICARLQIDGNGARFLLRLVLKGKACRRCKHEGGRQ